MLDTLESEKKTTVVPVWALNASEKMIAVGYGNGLFALFDIENGNFIGKYLATDGILHVKLLSSAFAIIVTNPGRIEFLQFLIDSISKRTEIVSKFQAEIHKNIISCLAISKNENFAFTGSLDKSIKILHLNPEFGEMNTAFPSIIFRINSNLKKYFQDFTVLFEF